MIAFARHEFRLSVAGKDGKPLRETLETVERMTRRRPAELDNPHELPGIVAHIWTAFCELSQGRQSGFGRLPFTWAEIESYARLVRLRLHAWEVRALRALDVEHLNSERANGS